MKKTSVYYLLLFFCFAISIQAQVPTGTDPRFNTTYRHHVKNNYICDSLFDLYTGNFSKWWSKLNVKGPIPGHKAPAHFKIPYSNLLLLDCLGNQGQLPDSIEAFFAFTSEDDEKNNQLSAILLLKDSVSFKEDTLRWRAWSKKNIKDGPHPVGFKVDFDDLDSLFHLMEDSSNPIKVLHGYFSFHSEKDIKENRISVVFRPTFKNKQKRVDNDKISCGKNSKNQAGRPQGQSYINIDFTNPCPPCDGSG